VTWRKLTTAPLSNKQVEACWHLAQESLEGTTQLKIVAKGSWIFTGSVLPACSPDGLTGFALSGVSTIIAGCPFGALIGKLGGSTASHHVPAEPSIAIAAQVPFAVGSFCILELPQGLHGPLYLGFNIVRRPVFVESLEAEIFCTP